LFAANVMAGTLAQTTGRTPAPDVQLLHQQAGALEKLTRGALAEMRLLMFELRPDALEQSKLAELLQHAIQALECRGDITVEQNLSSDDALPAPVRIQLYRIAQEALSNIARHSGATHVAVEWVAGATQRATLRIADNGRGFDPQQRSPGHFGLGNMQSRASEIGAVLTLNSAPGQGAEVRVELN
jgi:signal transduction histidine kinase